MEARLTIRVLLAGLLLFAMARPVCAQVPGPVPPLVSKGLEALEEGRCRDAFDAWTADWQYGPSVADRQELIQGCDNLHELGAALRGHSIVQLEYLTPFLCRVYVVLRYERRPMYLMVEAYAPVDGEWRVTAIKWSRDSDKVLPVLPVEPGPGG